MKEYRVSIEKRNLPNASDGNVNWCSPKQLQRFLKKPKIDLTVVIIPLWRTQLIWKPECLLCPQHSTITIAKEMEMTQISTDRGS